MKLSRSCFVLLGSLALGSQAHSLPSAEKYADVAVLSDGAEKPIVGEDGPLAFEDHDDPNTIYVPYDKVFITSKDSEDGNEPRFGLTYDRHGGLLCFTVRAGYSKLRRQQIGAYIASGKRVKPLAPMEGNWGISLNSKDNQQIFLGSPNEIKSALPDVPVAMCSFLNKHAIRYVVSSYLTGAGLGVNYHYTWRGVLTPMQIRASVHWNNFQKLVQRETKTSTTVKVESTGTYGPFDANGKASYSPVEQIRRITQIAIEKKIVKVWYRGEATNPSGNSELDRRLLDEVTKVVMGQQFKPVNSQWEKITATEPKTACETNLSKRKSIFGKLLSASGSACMARASSYVYNSETIWENREYVYEVTSEAIVNLPGAVGTNFSYVCRDYPKSFVNLEDKDHTYGCPTHYPARMSDLSDTLKTEENPSSPNAEMPAPGSNDNAPTVPGVTPPDTNGRIPSNIATGEDEVVDMGRYE